MEIRFRDEPPSSLKADVLIVPLYEDLPAGMTDELDTLTGGLASVVLKSKEFTGKEGQITLLHVTGPAACRVLLVGLGPESDATAEKIRRSGGKAFSHSRELGLKDAALWPEAFRTAQGSFKGARDRLFYFLEGGLLGLYRFGRYKTSASAGSLESVTVQGAGAGFPLAWLEVTTSAASFARDLVNTPSNEKMPAAIAGIARGLQGGPTEVKVLDRDEAGREGMQAFLSVAQGSAEPPQFIIVHYRGAEALPIVLVGKTITFDSGGLSIKPAEGMERMKYDMAGGAAVLAVCRAAAELGMPVNLVGILPAAENLPGGTASRPGDVVRTLSGKTVEIISTDAEGRMTLADALGYAVKYFTPKALIDIATLTGACSIALGGEAMAMMGNDEALMDAMREASEETFERVWQMPLYDEYREYLKSDIADLKNSGGKRGSLVAAGVFLKDFVGSTPWVHLDIACSAWNDKERPYLPKGGTGVGVRLLLNLLARLSS